MSSEPDERRGPGTTRFTIHFLDKSAPGTIGAAAILSLMSAAFAVVGVGGTTISAAVSGAFARSTVWTSSLVPLAVLDRRSATLALGIGAVAAVVLGGLLVFSAVRLGQGHRSGRLVLTVTCCALVVLKYSVGLMIGNLPVASLRSRHRGRVDADVTTVPARPRKGGGMRWSEAQMRVYVGALLVIVFGFALLVIPYRWFLAFGVAGIATGIWSVISGAVMMRRRRHR